MQMLFYQPYQSNEFVTRWLSSHLVPTIMLENEMELAAGFIPLPDTTEKKRSPAH